MKRIIISLVLMMICIYGIAEEMKKDVNIASYNEFLEYFKTDLEAFSHRFSDFDSISEELKEGIFDMDYNILEHIGGRIYLVQTAQNAIDIANIIVGNLLIEISANEEKAKDIIEWLKENKIDLEVV